MPNHVKNHITFTGVGEKEISLLRSLEQEEHAGALDFNKVFPMPEELNIESGSRTQGGLIAYSSYMESVNEETPENESLFRKQHPKVDDATWEIGKAAYHNNQKYGAPTWYEWSVQNWGTKWNSYDPQEMAVDGDQCTMTFSTAWSPPITLLMKLSQMMPDVEIAHEWADEDIGNNCGRVRLKGGHLREAYLPEPGKESIEFATSVWNATPADFHLRLNKDGTGYEFYDEDEDILDEFEPDTFDPKEQAGDEQAPQM